MVTPVTDCLSELLTENVSIINRFIIEIFIKQRMFYKHYFELYKSNKNKDKLSIKKRQEVKEFSVSANLINKKFFNMKR